jgi:hypothetical protein
MLRQVNILIWLYTENIRKESIDIYHVIIPGPVFGQEQQGGGIPVKTMYKEEVPIYTNQSIT